MFGIETIHPAFVIVAGVFLYFLVATFVVGLILGIISDDFPDNHPNLFAIMLLVFWFLWPIGLAVVFLAILIGLSKRVFDVIGKIFEGAAKIGLWIGERISNFL